MRAGARNSQAVSSDLSAWVPLLQDKVSSIFRAWRRPTTRSCSRATLARMTCAPRVAMHACGAANTPSPPQYIQIAQLKFACQFDVDAKEKLLTFIKDRGKPIAPLSLVHATRSDSLRDELAASAKLCLVPCSAYAQPQACPHVL